jgi:DNA-binding CsgD family transcriptional regulator
MEAEARHELARLTAEGLDGLRASLWLASLVYLSDACSLLGDERLASLLYSKLEPHAGTNVQIGHLVACYGAADRYLGALAATLGEWEQAEGHFEASLELNRRLGARTWLAHSEYEYARMLLARGRPEDRGAASTLLGHALTRAAEIGMPALAARAASLGQPGKGVSSHPDGLSGREVQILALVARGLSNREIGGELSISQHTAANHIRSILRKTGCANRTEAAAYAHRRGLVSA